MKFIWNKQECDVTVYRATYGDGSLHVYLEDESGRFLLSLSSEIYYSAFIGKSDCAYVNLGSLPDADRFIVANKLGRSTGKVVNVGVTKYYLYEFNLDMSGDRKI